MGGDKKRPPAAAHHRIPPEVSASKQRARPLYTWRKLSSAKWEDVWLERLGWLGQRLVIFVFGGMKTLRIEAHQLTRKEADALRGEFHGEVRLAKPVTLRDLEPKPRPPLRVRGKLIITGSEHDRARLARHRVPLIVIPASMAFGTGEHATTATCLRCLADIATTLRRREWEALDLGTGSGILAFAARRLGAQKVTAADFDPTALRVAKTNGKLNAITGVKFSRLDVLKWRPDRQWPVVAANVYGPILIEAAPQIGAAVERHGWLILSGILTEQSDDVTAAFRRRGFRFERIVRRGKWVTCVARRVR
jgi:ribosomal protein L11 methyltransferase